MCGNFFNAITDTGSPVSVLTKRDLLRKIGERELVVRREMIHNESYVDYNKSPLQQLNYQFLRVEVAG